MTTQSGNTISPPIIKTIESNKYIGGRIFVTEVSAASNVLSQLPRRPRKSVPPKVGVDSDESHLMTDDATVRENGWQWDTPP
jgi:hypothetical protein